MNALDVFQKALRELSDRYARELPQKLSEIDAAWSGIRMRVPGRDTLAGLQKLAHDLDVSASMLGAPALAEPARALEGALRALLQSGEAVSAEAIDRLAPMLAVLLREAEPQSLAARFGPFVASYPRYVRDETPRILHLLDPDPATALALEPQLARFGYRLRDVMRDPGSTNATTDEKPYAVLADIEFASPDRPNAVPVAALDRQSPDRPPVVFLSGTLSMQARLDAVRSGGMAYFVKPVDVPALVDKLDRLVTWELPEPYRVLVVDGDGTRAEASRAMLRESGMEASVVTRPADVLAALSDFNPELLLVALNLPGCTGDELARAVRQLPAHLSLPVVFLSEDADRDRQIELMNLGGDAVLPLPPRPWQLVSTVIARVERYRTLSALTQQDSLTGLLNHSRLQQYLGIETLRAARQFHALSFSMIDIDHFKLINDRHGHPVGDRVLKSLSRFLRRQLRKSDIVGRYGGEEFAVILTDTDANAAHAVMEKLCADFSAIEHDSDRGPFRVSFSAGVASLGTIANARDLVLAADLALYRAKDNGRNRVELWDGPLEMATAG